MAVALWHGDELLEQGVQDRLFSHAVYGVMAGGALLARRAFGSASDDTVFDLASLTKPLATATLIMLPVGLLDVRA